MALIANEKIELQSLAFSRGASHNISYLVPSCSGLTGENLVERVSIPESDWYKDKPTLIEAIDTFLPPVRLVEKPFRMSISDVYKVS